MNQMAQRLIGGLARFNDAHPWSHNETYSSWILRHARAVRRQGGDRALDVGCGTGKLLKRLADAMTEVVGVEPDSPTADRARATLAERKNATVVAAAFNSATLDSTTFAPASFDLVTFVAVLHHLPLEKTLESARTLLRPRGRLIVVGLAREDAADLPRSAASALLNPLVGLVRHPRRAISIPESMTAPMAEPMETFDQIAAIAKVVLSGAKMRRGLFWRYTLVWVNDRG